MHESSGRHGATGSSHRAATALLCALGLGASGLVLAAPALPMADRDRRCVSGDSPIGLPATVSIEDPSESKEHDGTAASAVDADGEAAPPRPAPDDDGQPSAAPSKRRAIDLAAPAPSPFLAPPPNDQCSGAEVIPAAGPFPYMTALTADITAATTTGDPIAVPGCATFGGPVSRSIWYRFTPAVSGSYTITSCANAPTGTTVDDTVIAVYTSVGGCGGPFTQVPGACDDDGCSVEDLQSVLTSTLLAGTTYYVLVWQFGTAAPPAGNTAVQLRVTLPPPPPPNDECADAVLIPAAGPFPHLTPVADVTSAASLGDPSLCAPFVGHTAWYTFTPAVTATYGIASCQVQAPGTTLSDSVLGVFTSPGGCGGPFGQVACNDEDPSCSGGPSRSKLTARLIAGTTYYVLVGSFGLGTPNPANVQLAVSSPPTNDSCGSPAPVTLGLPVIGATYPSSDDYRLSGPACFAGPGQTPSGAAGGDVVYSFSPPVSGAYSFRATGYSLAGNLVLHVADACPPAAPGTPVTLDGCLGAANRTSPPPTAANANSAEEVPCLPLLAGRNVFIVVDNDLGFPGSPFRLEVTRCASELEPNDSTAGANPPACGIEGSVVPAADVDVYTLGSPPAGSRVFGLVDGVVLGSNDLQLRATTQADTLEFDEDNGTPPFGELSPNLAGAPLTGAASFLRVNHKLPGTEVQPYRMYSVIEPAIGSVTLESEPNGTLAQSDAAPGNYFSGGLAGPAPSTDVDIYRFTALPGSLILLALDADPLRNNTPINAALALLDAGGAALVAVNDSASQSNVTSGAGILTATTPFSPGEALTYRAATQGTYYARVTIGTTSTTGIGAGDYLLSISIDCLTADADADGAPDGQDCRPADASAWAAPSAATNLRLSGGGATALAWSSPHFPGATTVRYDLLRSPSPSNFTAATVCLASNTTAMSAIDGAVPAPLHCYLVRSENTCGENLGSSSSGALRTGRACP